jgi:hypothetical protein
MFFISVALFLFFAVRAFLYFRGGRAIAGVFASLACLLFFGGIYVDYARHTKVGAEVAQPAV